MRSATIQLARVLKPPISYLLRQIVHLQTDWIGAGALDRIDYLDYFAVLRSARGAFTKTVFSIRSSSFTSERVSIPTLYARCSFRCWKHERQSFAPAARYHSPNRRILIQLDRRSGAIETTKVNGLGFSLLKSSFGSRCVGMSAWNRLGFSGVTTMKMISSTSKTSINGVTLIYGTQYWTALLDVYPYPLLTHLNISPRTCCELRSRSWGSCAALLLVSNQANLVDAQFSDFVDDVHHVAIAHANTALDVDDSILFVLDFLQHRIDFVGQFFLLRSCFLPR